MPEGRGRDNCTQGQNQAWNIGAGREVIAGVFPIPSVVLCAPYVRCNESLVAVTICVPTVVFTHQPMLNRFILLPKLYTGLRFEIGIRIAKRVRLMARRSQRFFRYVWRVNGVLIFVAAGLVIVGVGSLMIQQLWFDVARNRGADMGIAVAEPNAKSDLVLGRASIVQGTQVMRAELQRFPGEAKFSSGSSETRNILFIEPGEKAAHWLLPDNDHIIVDSSDIKVKEGSMDDPVVVTAALVKSATESPETATGKLLVFDPPGSKIVEVADRVRTIQVVHQKGRVEHPLRA
jgi:hypothetical protein